MDGPWVDHAWPCMGVHGISVRGENITANYLLKTAGWAPSFKAALRTKFFRKFSVISNEIWPFPREMRCEID